MARIPVWLVAVLVIGALLVAVPFAPWIALALWLGLYAQRIHHPLTKKLGGRKGLAATLTVSMLLLIALPIAAVIASIVMDAVQLVRQLMESGALESALEKLVQNGGQANETPGPQEGASSGPQGILDLVMSQGDRALAIGMRVASAAASFVIGLLVMVTGMYGVLMCGAEWYAWWERHLPLAPAHLRRFADAFVETGRGLWWGIVGAGVLQSIVATITYLVLGVPSALALGMLTLLFSVIPAIGTAIVWVPVAAGLAVTGRTGSAIAMAVIGVVVIGSADNFARPFLARKGELQLPTWALLVSMFGGVELIGGWGLLIGPLVMRLAKEAVLIARDSRLVGPIDQTQPGGTEQDPARSGEPVVTPHVS